MGFSASAGVPCRSPPFVPLSFSAAIVALHGPAGHGLTTPSLPAGSKWGRDSIAIGRDVGDGGGRPHMRTRA
jgi:hypothetical protein